MAIDYDQIMQIKTEGIRLSYGDRETILYALGVGFGQGASVQAELPFVYEGAPLVAAPTMPSIIGSTRRVTDAAGINYAKIVHAEERLTLLKPFPAAADLVYDERVSGAFDKGADKGALVLIERVVRDAASREHLCTLVHTIFARSDGGFGGPRDGAPEPHPLPSRTPDFVAECPTRPDQALLYALSGDRNPLHRDPNAATMAGFNKPILHGLCTYGIACRAILREVCGYDAGRISGFDSRFSAPVFPGETIIVEGWVDGLTVSFRAKTKDRGAVVLNNGKCTLKR